MTDVITQPTAAEILERMETDEPYRQSVLESAICPECGQMRIATCSAASGIVCPAGHGKIHTALPQSVLNAIRRRRWLAALPKATPCESDGRHYQVDGHEGLFQVVPWRIEKLHGGETRAGRLRTRYAVPVGELAASDGRVIAKINERSVRLLERR